LALVVSQGESSSVAVVNVLNAGEFIVRDSASDNMSMRGVSDNVKLGDQANEEKEEKGDDESEKEDQGVEESKGEIGE
jgi:hypothetical protein